MLALRVISMCDERPHHALDMQCPTQRYCPSSRPYRGLPDLDYPFHDRAATVTTCGRICFNRQKIAATSMRLQRHLLSNPQTAGLDARSNRPLQLRLALLVNAMAFRLLLPTRPYRPDPAIARRLHANSGS